MLQPGWEESLGKIVASICMAESLPCSPETITTLLISYTPIQHKKFKKRNLKSQVPVVQSLSCVQLFATPKTAASQASLSFTISLNLLKLMLIELVMPSNHLILRRPLLLPSVFPSSRVFSNESVLHIRWPKNWSFSISPSNEYSGLISFRIDWFPLGLSLIHI